ncbi:MAG: leucine-rich repeat protein [Oscillospiraceae bacterium]|nr:leucine-rich repeat protein [Oscillospiraceae bacterium]
MGERIFTREDAKGFLRTNSEKVKLPSDYTVIGQGALAGFSQMKELTIPEGVTKICSHAFFIRSFRGTSMLEKLTLPSSLRDFELWCFYDCNALKSVVLPEDFPEQKAMELFFHCPKAVLTFGKKLFSAKKKTVQQIMDETSGILSLGSAMMLPITDDGTLKIPSNYLYILPQAMRNLANRGVKRVVIPEKMRIISPGVFSNLTSLEEIVVSDGLTYIDNGAFAGCRNLKRIILPDSVKRIGASAFMNLPMLESIRLPKELTAIEDELFSGCTALKQVEFSGKETRIGAGAFNECTALTQVKLPDSVRSIGICAFWNCTSLQRLSIPSETESIGQSALCNCPSLSRLYMPRIIHDGPEQKRVFGDQTAPEIFWLEPGTASPDFDGDADSSYFEIPDFPSSLPFGFASSAQNDMPFSSDVQAAEPAVPAAEEAVRAEEPAAPAAVQTEPSVDEQTVQKLQETIAAMQAKLEEMQRRTESEQSSDSAAADTIQQQPEPVLQPAAEAVTEEQPEPLNAEETGGENAVVQQEKAAEIPAEPEVQAEPAAEAPVSVSAEEAEPEMPAEPVEEISVSGSAEEPEPEITESPEDAAFVPQPEETVPAAGPEAGLFEVNPSAETAPFAEAAAAGMPEPVPAETEAFASEPEPFVGTVPAAEVPAIEAAEPEVQIPEPVPAADEPEETLEFDSCISFVPLHHGDYDASERVFTREISKPLLGPKERSAALKEYTVIAYRSFREAQPGERFEIPEGVRRIETQAFWDAPRLMAIEIPSSLSEVEPDAFSGANRLTDIYVRDGYSERKIVEYFLFRPDAKVHWPKKGLLSKPRVTTIGELMEQFDDILTPAKAKKLTVRGHILQIPEGYTIIAPSALQQIDQRSDDPEQVLRTIFLPKTVRRIGTKAFAGLENVMHIVIPSGLQIVDMNAFTGCLGPRRIVLPDSVQYIGPRAFAAPCNYEQIRLPAKIRSLPENAIADCNTLVSLRIPDSVEQIGDFALAGCTALSSLTIPKRFEEQLPAILDGPVKLNVTWTEGQFASYQQKPTAEILSVVEPNFPPVQPQRMFTQELSASCSSFAERIAVLHAHPFIAPFALSEMANQTKFEIPLGVMRLSSYSFGNNSRLLTLTVPKALTEFEYAAFYGCQKLRDVFLPDEFDRGCAAVLFMRRPQILVTFGTARAVRVRQLTAECPWILSAGDAADLTLDHVTLRIPEGYLVLASYMYHGVMGLQRLHRIELPHSARLIGSLAFVQLPYLEEVVCPEGLLAVEPDAFTDCPSLKRIVLPKSLRFLGVHAFHGCNELTSIVLPSRFADRAAEITRDCPHASITWLPDDIDEQTEQPNATESLVKSGETVIPVSEKPLSAAEHTEQAIERAKALLAQDESESAPAGEEIPAAEPTAEPAEDAIADTAAEISEAPAAEESEIAADTAAEETSEAAEAVGEPETGLTESTTDDEAEKTDLTAGEIHEEIGKVAESIFGDEPTEEPTEEDVPAPVEPEATEIPHEEEVSPEIQALAESLFAGMSEPAEQEAETEVAPADFEENPDSLERSDLNDLSAMEPIAGSGATPEEIGRSEDDSAELADIRDLASIDGAETTAESVPDEASAPSEPEEAETESETAETEQTDTELPAVEEPEAAETEPETETEEPAEPEEEETPELHAVEEPEAAETESETETEEQAESEEEEMPELPTGEEPEAADAEPETETEEPEEPEEEEMPELPAVEEPEAADAEPETETEEPEEPEEEEMPELPAIELPEPSEAEAEPTEEAAVPAAEDMPGLTIPVDLSGGKEPEAAVSELEYIKPEGEPVAEPEPEPDDEPDAAVLIEKMQLADALGITLDDSDIVQIMTEEPPEWPVHVEDFGSRIEPGMLPESELAGQPPIPEDGKFTAKEFRMRYKGEPEFSIPHGFTEIRAGACAAMDEIEKLIVPDTVTRIGSGAFADSPSLTEIYIPSSVEEIAEDAFEGCESLMRVTMPRSLEAAALKMFGLQTHIIWLESAKPTIIGDGRFTAKIRAKVYDGGDVLTIPEGYTEIRAGACAGLEDLTAVVLPGTLTKICGGAFADCTGLTELTIPAGVTDLDPDAFEGCTAVTRVIVSQQLADAAKECFPNAAILVAE